MKKLNNRGFAISTMLYGLLVVLILLITLLMSTMSFNRENSREFTDTVIDELENPKSNISKKSKLKNNAAGVEFDNKDSDLVVYSISSNETGTKLSTGREYTLKTSFRLSSVSGECKTVHRNPKSTMIYTTYIGTNSLENSSCNIENENGQVNIPLDAVVNCTATVPNTNKKIGEVYIIIPNDFFRDCYNTSGKIKIPTGQTFAS